MQCKKSEGLQNASWCLMNNNNIIRVGNIYPSHKKRTGHMLRPLLWLEFPQSSLSACKWGLLCHGLHFLMYLFAPRKWLTSSVLSSAVVWGYSWSFIYSLDLYNVSFPKSSKTCRGFALMLNQSLVEMRTCPKRSSRGKARRKSERPWRRSWWAGGDVWSL